MAQHDQHAGKNPNAPTLENVAKMLVGAGFAFGSLIVGLYCTYLVVVYSQTL